MLRNFRKWAEILSGLGALEISNSISKLRTPLTSTEMVAISGKGESEIVGGVRDSWRSFR